MDSENTCSEIELSVLLINVISLMINQTMKINWVSKHEELIQPESKSYLPYQWKDVHIHLDKRLDVPHGIATTIYHDIMDVVLLLHYINMSTQLEPLYPHYIKT